MHVDSVNADSNGTGLAGGVGLYVKECLIVTPCKDIDLNTNNCENLWVDIQLKNEKTLTLGIVYRHPKSNLVEFQEKLHQSVYHLHKLKKTFYICGDFNIDLMQYDKNKFVHDYFNMLHSQGCISLINKPTRITPISRTLIDHLYTNDVTTEITCKVLLHDISDHLPFIFHIPFSSKKKKYEKIKIRDFKKFIAENFLEDLDEAFKNSRISLNNLNIHEHFHQFKSVFSDILNKHAPTRLQTRKESKWQKNRG